MKGVQVMKKTSKLATLSCVEWQEVGGGVNQYGEFCYCKPKNNWNVVEVSNNNIRSRYACEHACCDILYDGSGNKYTEWSFDSNNTGEDVNGKCRSDCSIL